MDHTTEADLLFDRIDELQVQIEILQAKLNEQRQRGDRWRHNAEAWRSLFQTEEFTEADTSAAETDYAALIEADQNHA